MSAMLVAINAWQNVRESVVPRYVDQEVPEVPAETHEVWPKLIPAGIRPKPDVEETIHRTHV